MVTTLPVLTFEQFKDWLVYDIKLSGRASVLYSVARRFKVIQSYFVQHNLPFSRENFTKFIASERDRGLSNASLNKYISLVKLIAKYLKVEGFEDITYFKTPSQKGAGSSTKNGGGRF